MSQVGLCVNCISDVGIFILYDLMGYMLYCGLIWKDVFWVMSGVLVGVLFMIGGVCVMIGQFVWVIWIVVIMMGLI